MGKGRDLELAGTVPRDDEVDIWVLATDLGDGLNHEVHPLAVHEPGRPEGEKRFW